MQLNLPWKKINWSDHFVIKPDIYPFDILISVEESDETLYSYINKNYPTLTGDDKKELKMVGNGRCILLFEQRLIIIRLLRLPKKYDMMDVITHETFHAITFLMWRIGMKLEINVSDEAYAYLCYQRNL
jgi:hypothetical protein